MRGGSCRTHIVPFDVDGGAVIRRCLCVRSGRRLSVRVSIRFIDSISNKHGILTPQKVRIPRARGTRDTWRLVRVARVPRGEGPRPGRLPLATQE